MIEHIFVYGTLRRGQGANRVFGMESAAEYVGTFNYEGAQMYTLGGFPGIKLTPDDRQSIIVGDLYKVRDPSLLLSLDSYEGYDPRYPEHSLYIRTEIEVNGCPCYVYEYNRSLPETARIRSGDWAA